MVTKKWTYKKQRSFASNYLIFWKNLFQFKNHLYRVDFLYQQPNAHICTFCKRWSFIWCCFFPGSILKIKFFWSKGYDVIIFVHDVTNKNLWLDSNYVTDVVIRKYFYERSYHNLNFFRGVFGSSSIILDWY